MAWTWISCVVVLKCKCLQNCFKGLWMQSSHYLHYCVFLLFFFFIYLTKSHYISQTGPGYLSEKSYIYLHSLQRRCLNASMPPLCLCHRRVSRPDLYHFTISCFEWHGDCLSCSTLWAVTTTLSKQPESAQCLSKLSQSLDKHLREKLWPLNHLQTSSWCMYLYETWGLNNIME